MKRRIPVIVYERITNEEDIHKFSQIKEGEGLFLTNIGGELYARYSLGGSNEDTN